MRFLRATLGKHAMNTFCEMIFDAGVNYTRFFRRMDNTIFVVGIILNKSGTK